MSGNRFQEILAALQLTNEEPPHNEDKFHPVCKMIDAWNLNMTQNFIPSWMSCLDESMCPWVSRYTCPGWMVVPQKPHPFGNKYHSICCGESGIMYCVELVEGKDQPVQRPKPKYDEKGKTVGLMLQMTSPIHGTGKVVMTDSRFCVLDGLMELKRVGVYSSTVVKKGDTGQDTSMEMLSPMQCLIPRLVNQTFCLEQRMINLFMCFV